MPSKKEINDELQTACINESFEEVKHLCKQYNTENLSPATLGMIFEAYISYTGQFDKNSMTSEKIPIATLIEIHPGFASTNGCQWARTDNSYLGKKYNIERELNKGKVYSIKLSGKNDKESTNRSIRSDIREALKNNRCAILDIGERLEIDHKNGRYDDIAVLNTETQTLEDFQVLSKAANDAKRQHCKECQRDKKRFDATRLGYKKGWIEGDENSDFCQGCYWYDPHHFNEIMSKQYN